MTLAQHFKSDDAIIGVRATGCCFLGATTTVGGEPHVRADRRFGLGVAAHEAGHIVASCLC